MLGYVIRRVLIAIPLLLVMSMVTFFLMQSTPGNFLDTIRMDPRNSPEVIARYEKLYHLDKPIWQQYLQWVRNLFHLEFGYSFYYNVPVARIIASRLWNTFILSLSILMFTWAVAIPLGIWAALRRNRFSDRCIQFFSYIGLASPSFFLAIVFLYLVSQVGGLPLGGIRGVHYEEMNFWQRWIDLLKHLAIPTLAVSLGSIGSLQKIMRGNMLDVLRQQYILMARAKGLPENKVVYKHALRNAINPLITILGYEFSGLLSGAALTEIICSWPGLGMLMLTAVRSKDVYLVMASMMMGGILFLLGNLIADILLAMVDPRIRYE